MAFPLLGLLPFAEKLVDRIFPNPSDAAEAKLKLLELEQTGQLAVLAAETDLAKGQQSINLEEAKSANLFISGWRPFIGWTCGSAFAYHFILQPLIAFGFAMAGERVDLPVFDMDALFTVLMGMLGLGGMRSFEKSRGVSSK